MSEILANEEQWLNVDATSLAGRSKRRRQSDYPDIEEGLWIHNTHRSYCKTKGKAVYYVI